MNNKLYLIISRVFNIDISLVNNNSSPKTIDAWDSMNMYVLINEVETEFGIKFSSKQNIVSVLLSSKVNIPEILVLSISRLILLSFNNIHAC